MDAAGALDFLDAAWPGLGAPDSQAGGEEALWRPLVVDARRAARSGLTARRVDGRVGDPLDRAVVGVDGDVQA